MEQTRLITLHLGLEERAVLLDTVITALAKLQVERFHARDPVLCTRLDEQRQQMEGILKKLLTVSQRIGIEEPTGDRPGAELKERAA